MAPEERSDWPVMLNFFSCRAVSRCCWLSMRRVFDLVDEQYALVGLVDGSGLDPVVRRRLKPA